MPIPLVLHVELCGSTCVCFFLAGPPHPTFCRSIIMQVQGEACCFTRQPESPNVHISVHLRLKHHQNSTRRHPEREERMKIVAGEGKKRAKFWGGPAEGGPAEGGPAEGGVRRRGPQHTHHTHTTTTTTQQQQQHSTQKHRNTETHKHTTNKQKQTTENTPPHQNQPQQHTKKKGLAKNGLAKIGLAKIGLATNH